MNDFSYVIKKILNNNVVISEDINSNEIIVMGAGIGFHKHIHDLVDTSKIFKIYELRSNSFRQRFEALTKEIPYKCFELSEKIIENSKKKLKKDLNQNLILTLADHINFAVYCYNNGMTNAVLMNEEIKRFYPDEYDAGKEAVKLINEYYEITITPNEAASIAFHLINAESGQKANETTKILTVTQEILQIIEKSLKIKLNEESNSYSRLVIHLKYFIKRTLIDNESNDDSIEQSFFNENDEQYKKVSKCINEITAFLLEKYQYKMVETEKVYLVIHIIRVLQTNK